MESPNGINASLGDVEKQRDRGRRGERGTRFSDNKDESRDRSREKMGGNGKRVYVSNIPYEYRWQDLKGWQDAFYFIQENRLQTISINYFFSLL